jgi:hypothetical protein
MEKQDIGKGVIFLALLGLGAFGVLAGAAYDRSTIEVAVPERTAKPYRGQDGVASPRECSLQQGIDAACTFL